jgi:CO/xanthine dehydrogenase Mo-binding subunit
VDAIKLVQGKPAFALDMEMRGMLVAKVLHSPFAHAKLKKIDTTEAEALPGVAVVLTWEDLPRVAYSTAGQSDPIPGPLDTFSLDKKVRFVGDRVAFVAAETEEIAEQALNLIRVEYEPLPFILDPAEALSEGAPQISVILKKDLKRQTSLWRAPTRCQRFHRLRSSRMLSLLTGMRMTEWSFAQAPRCPSTFGVNWLPSLICRLSGYG